MTSEIKAETLVLEANIICSDAANRCEDCPVTNPNPPSDSDCPNFEIMGGEPFCTKEDGTRREIYGRRKSIGFGNIACPQIIEFEVSE